MPEIAILLALHNGAEHLREQIDSFHAQTLRDWMLLVGDDGSTDAGPDIVKACAATTDPGRIVLLQGPRQGAAANFLFLLSQVPEGVPHACFSDQDDVWLPHKLERAVSALKALPAHEPAVYTSRTLVCDETLDGPRPSRLNRKPADFRNALVQNIVSGNTAVLNRTGLDLLRAASNEAEAAQGGVVLHDWWVYQIVTGAGGRVIVDPEPGLLYRQHRDNLVGANDGVFAAAKRAVLMVGGRYREWNRRNVAALARSAHRFTPQNRTLLEDFAAGRRAGLAGRLTMVRRLGLYRQTALSQAGLWAAALIGRI